jgi:hypothetical protein
MKRVLIIIGLFICTIMFIWLGVSALNVAFVEYTSITADVSVLTSVGHGLATIANSLAAVIYFIFGYKGCVLMVKCLAKRK